MRSLLLVAVLLLPWSTACHVAPSEHAQLAIGAVERVAFEVDLGSWQSAAELVHPVPGGPHGAGPWPVVLMIAGNGPHDMDVTLPGPDGTVRLFAQIAEVLAARGCAVVRYHKRWVSGPGEVDPQFWLQQSTVQFTADANTVLDAVLAMPGCDRDRLFLYGWSEGTAVAAQLAVTRGDIDGLVLQGAVGLPWREMVRGWIEDVGLPYAQGPADGTVTADGLTAALRGSGGLVAKLGASFLAQPSRREGPVRVSRALDTNGDGVLDRDTEVRPAIDKMLDYAFSPFGNVYIYAPGRTVPTVTEQSERLTMPVLILQGENDASTPLRSARALAMALHAAGNTDVTLIELPGLGHTLGPAISLSDDCGRAPTNETLLPITEWIARHARR